MSDRRQSLRRDHPCCGGFLDETGAIAKDRFFAVGLLKSAEPSRVLRRIQKLRDRRHWYNEIKFSNVTKGALEFYQSVIDECLVHDDTEFFCFVCDRASADPVERFGSHWEAYSKLAEQLVVASLHPGELMSLVADNYSTPDYVVFEEQLRARVNARLKRLAVVSVCRQDSKSTDGLQLADLLTSAIAFEFRAKSGLAAHGNPKGLLAAHVLQQLGTSSCLNGWTNGIHSVRLYNHGGWKPVCN